MLRCRQNIQGGGRGGVHHAVHDCEDAENGDDHGDGDCNSCLQVGLIEGHPENRDNEGQRSA